MHTGGYSHISNHEFETVQGAVSHGETLGVFAAPLRNVEGGILEGAAWSAFPQLDFGKGPDAKNAAPEPVGRCENQQQVHLGELR